MLSILGLIAVAIATYYTYKTAKDTGRNAFGWAALTFAVGFGIQIIIPILIAVVITIVMVSSGKSVPQIQESLETPAIIIEFACLFLSGVGIWLVLRRVSTIPEDESVVIAPPPPPPTFDGQ